MSSVIRRRGTRPAMLTLLAAACLHGTGLGAQQQPASTSAPMRVDVIIRGGRVLDGSGNPWVTADVGITGGVVSAVGDLTGVDAARVIDARGLYVAPGFIDTHSHSGESLADSALGGAQQLLAQGITTVFVNPDGGGSTDLDAQRRSYMEHGLGVNVAQMVPHGAVRQAVLGMADRAPDAAELRRMEEIVERGMEAGAFGLSSGPFYAPGSYAKTEELVELARVAARYGAPYQSHIRDESDYSIGLLAAVEEVITVAREAGTRGVVTHVKALGPNVWGFSAAIVQRVERARSQGVQLFADQYPYDASQTSLTAALVPRWAQVGGDDSLRARLADPATRARVVAEMHENLARRGGADRIRIGRYARETALEGHSLAEIATMKGKDAIEAAIDIVSSGGAGIVSFNMIDEDIERLMRQPWTMTASDGGLVPAGRGVPHPRGNGAFSRKLRRYVIDEPVVDLAFAIRSMTSLPASVYNVADRGSIRPGARADIVVFDLARVRDRSTFDDPHQIAEGMVHVFVNGQAAVSDGGFTGARAGQVLRRGGAARQPR